MAEFVRISHPLYEASHPAKAAPPEGARIIDRPAVDAQGRPLPTKPRISIGDTAKKAAKPTTTTDKKKD